MATFLVQTFVRPQVAERVFLDLASSGKVQDLYAQEIQGSGSRTQLAAPSSVDLDLLPKVLISAVVSEQCREDVISSIRALASMGRRGDGKIMIMPIESEIVR